MRKSMFRRLAMTMLVLPLAVVLLASDGRAQGDAKKAADKPAVKKQRAAERGRLPRHYKEVVTDDQRKKIDALRLAKVNDSRDARNAIERPTDRRDYKAQRDYWQLIRDSRKQVEEDSAAAMVMVLTDEQKKLNDNIIESMDERDAKIEQADRDCDEALIEILGREKLDPMHGRRAGQPRTAPAIPRGAVPAPR
jgi:hypothetical protein